MGRGVCAPVISSTKEVFPRSLRDIYAISNQNKLRNKERRSLGELGLDESQIEALVPGAELMAETGPSNASIEQCHFTSLLSVNRIPAIDSMLHSGSSHAVSVKCRCDIFVMRNNVRNRIYADIH